MPQPYLHDLVCAVRAPALAVCGTDGQIRSEGVHGVYVGDRRIVSHAVWTIDGAEPTALQGHPLGGDAARFVATVRTLGDRHADPTVLVRRERTTVHYGAEEQVEVASYARAPVRATLSLTVASDLADLVTVRGGAAASALPAAAQPDGMHWRGRDGSLVHVRTDVPPDAVHSEVGRLDWTIDLARGEVFSLHITYRLAEDRGPAIVAPATVSAFGSPSVVSGDHRLSALVAQSVADLDALLLADPLEPGDVFLSAGVPWYLTLFGRDSIWAARMLLPLGTDLAAGTLRTLARRQGVHSDPETAEQPGKILHEIRRPLADPAAQRRTLPPVYYGTVDATPVWISLLHDAWRWGLPEADVVELLPALESALGWLADHALDSSGFVSYQDASGRGLANQGWKDSFDSVQFRDGRLAAPPIALCEVQAYAHAAARHGADLLDAFGRPGGARWRDWAAVLADRFRGRFWVGDDYPAIALDGDGHQVDTVTSNIGHLLGTGLLDAAEEQRVIARLGAPDLDCGYGLRTMSSTSAGFNPISYHGGAVWPHDTAIALSGAAGADSPDAGSVADGLIRGLLAAGHAFDYRLPELFAGDTARAGVGPVPYPASCRPQAWSAAAAVVVLSTLLGLRPDVPNGVLRLAPLRPSPVGELIVRGLRVAGDALDVRLAADGTAEVLSAPSKLRIELAG